MPAPDPLAQAYQAIGEYFCAFSAVEYELGEAIKVAFGLQNNEASDAIIAALGDFSRKGRLVQTAIRFAKKGDGSPTSDDWKTKVDATIKKALGCNDPDRILLAHSLLEPNADGSVDFVRLQVRDGKVTGKEGFNWPHKDFSEKISVLKELAKELQAVNTELRTVKITIPAGDLSWMSGDPMRSFSNRASGALMSGLSNPCKYPPQPQARPRNRQPCSSAPLNRRLRLGARRKGRPARRGTAMEATISSTTWVLTYARRVASQRWRKAKAFAVLNFNILCRPTWVGKNVILDGDPAGLLHAVKYFSKMFALTLTFVVVVAASRFKLYEGSSEWREFIEASAKLVIAVAIIYLLTRALPDRVTLSRLLQAALYVGGAYVLAEALLSIPVSSLSLVVPSENREIDVFATERERCLAHSSALYWLLRGDMKFFLYSDAWKPADWTNWLLDNYYHVLFVPFLFIFALTLGPARKVSFVFVCFFTAVAFVTAVEMCPICQTPTRHHAGAEGHEVRHQLPRSDH